MKSAEITSSFTAPAASQAADHASILERLDDAMHAVDAYLAGQPAELTSAANRRDVQTIELSVVMPCLNEADTLATCIRKAQQAMRKHDIAGEIVIADNGSTDDSQEIAASLGARVVHVAEKGYGNALRGGINASRGQYVLMGDADDSYDFLELPKFLEQLRAGHALVQGCRLPSGGGRVMPGAMPPSHRWLGNPMFSWLVRRMFRAPIHDVYCGLRGFTRELYDRLELRSTGMEFATEMIIKSSLFNVDIAEVPTTLHPDGRKAHAPHLRTVRDGWRTLRFFLMYSPRWLFLTPGVCIFLLGLIGYTLALPGITLAGATLDAHTLLVASLAMLLGSQAVQFAVFAKTFAISEGLIPEDDRMRRFRRVVTLERGLALGVAATLFGGGLLVAAVNQWRAAGFGALDYATTMRWVIPGVTLAALGCQTMFSSFFLSILRMARK
jgi:glycosyltransferase involved in cell wall biosynthesis